LSESAANGVARRAVRRALSGTTAQAPLGTNVTDGIPDVPEMLRKLVQKSVETEVEAVTGAYRQPITV
jgi:hypothetical protein